MIPRRRYGKTGALVSRLGFGAMRLPVIRPDKTVTFEDSSRMLRRAIELGINIFDSHHNYLDGHGRGKPEGEDKGKHHSGCPRP